MVFYAALISDKNVIGHRRPHPPVPRSQGICTPRLAFSNRDPPTTAGALDLGPSHYQSLTSLDPCALSSVWAEASRAVNLKLHAQ